MTREAYTPGHRPTGSPLWALLALGAVGVSVNSVAYADDSETIYLQRVSVGTDGTRSYYAEGSNIVSDPTG